MTTEVGTSTVVSAQRKRALDILERQYGATKSQTSQQLDKNKRRAPNEKEREEKLRKWHEVASFSTPERDTSFKKDEEAHAVYCELAHNVHENLVKPQVQHSNGRTTTLRHVIHDLLQNGDSAQKYMQGSRSMNIDNFLLLDNFVPPRNTLQNARVRALQSHSKRSKKHMSMRQLRMCGSLKFPQESARFDFFKPCHEMWKEYIRELIQKSGKRQLGHILLTASLDGAILQVVECKVAAFTGVSGIMIRETAETFGIITQDDKFRVVPKKGSVFIFQAGCWKVTLCGDKLSEKRGFKI